MLQNIQLTDEQARQLRELAVAEGRSMAEVARDGIDLLLRSRWCPNREVIKRRSLEALGCFHSGVTDLAVAHDRYLDEAFGE